MTIVAIADALLDGAMRARFHGDPIDAGDRAVAAGADPRDVAVALPWAAEAKAAVPAARSRRPAAGA